MVRKPFGPSHGDPSLARQARLLLMRSRPAPVIVLLILTLLVAASGSVLHCERSSQADTHRAPHDPSCCIDLCLTAMVGASTLGSLQRPFQQSLPMPVPVRRASHTPRLIPPPRCAASRI